MSYRVEFTAAAARQVRKLPRPARDRVLDAIEDLGEDPRPHGAKKLVGELRTQLPRREFVRHTIHDR